MSVEEAGCGWAGAACSCPWQHSETTPWARQTAFLGPSSLSCPAAGEGEAGAAELFHHLTATATCQPRCPPLSPPCPSAPRTLSPALGTADTGTCLSLRETLLFSTIT